MIGHGTVLWTGPDLISVTAGDTVRVGTALLQPGTDLYLHNEPFRSLSSVLLLGVEFGTDHSIHSCYHG
jgi:hypothetical protein